VQRAARLSSFPIRVFLAEAWLLDVTTLYCVQNYRLQETPCQRQFVFNIWWMWRHHKNWCWCYAHDTYPTAWYRDNFVDCERTHLFTTGFFMKFCLFYFLLSFVLFCWSWWKFMRRTVGWIHGVWWLRSTYLIAADFLMFRFWSYLDLLRDRESVPLILHMCVGRPTSQFIDSRIQNCCYTFILTLFLFIYL
jgi:hypothetical protein